mmetsp:Transcript_1531/g.6404  ORF Transcript_1531/g.6404 Transcript_1531/m.6404 type:complete len:554 (+) Transcript_1531:3515-5176(+)
MGRGVRELPQDVHVSLRRVPRAHRARVRRIRRAAALRVRGGDRRGVRRCPGDARAVHPRTGADVQPAGELRATRRRASLARRRRRRRRRRLRRRRLLRGGVRAVPALLAAGDLGVLPARRTGPRRRLGGQADRRRPRGGRPEGQTRVPRVLGRHPAGEVCDGLRVHRTLARDAVAGDHADRPVLLELQLRGGGLRPVRLRGRDPVGGDPGDASVPPVRVQAADAVRALVTQPDAVLLQHVFLLPGVSRVRQRVPPAALARRLRRLEQGGAQLAHAHQGVRAARAHEGRAAVRGPVPERGAVRGGGFRDVGCLCQGVERNRALASRPRLDFGRGDASVDVFAAAGRRDVRVLRRRDRARGRGRVPAVPGDALRAGVLQGGRLAQRQHDVLHGSRRLRADGGHVCVSVRLRARRRRRDTARVARRDAARRVRPHRVRGRQEAGGRRGRARGAERTRHRRVHCAQNRRRARTGRRARRRARRRRRRRAGRVLRRRRGRARGRPRAGRGRRQRHRARSARRRAASPRHDGLLASEGSDPRRRARRQGARHEIRARDG